MLTVRLSSRIASSGAGSKSSRELQRFLTPAPKISRFRIPQAEDDASVESQERGASDLLENHLNRLMREKGPTAGNVVQRALIRYEDCLILRLKVIAAQIGLLSAGFATSFSLRDSESLLALVLCAFLFFFFAFVRAYVLSPDAPPGYRPSLYLLSACVCECTGGYFFMQSFDERQAFFYTYAVRACVQVLYLLSSYKDITALEKFLFFLVAALVGSCLCCVCTSATVADLYKCYALLCLLEALLNGRNFVEYFGPAHYPKTLPLLTSILANDILLKETLRRFFTNRKED